MSFKNTLTFNDSNEVLEAEAKFYSCAQFFFINCEQAVNIIQHINKKIISFPVYENIINFRKPLGRKAVLKLQLKRQKITVDHDHDDYSRKCTKS